MEEIYILPDGTTVDISGYSQLNRTKFLLENPSAKKSKDTAQGANVVSKKQKAPSTELSSEKSLSGSKKKFRLPTDEEYESYSKNIPGKVAYSSPGKKSSVEDYYNLKPQTTIPINNQQDMEAQAKDVSMFEKIQKANPRNLGAKRLTKEEVEQDGSIQAALQSGFLRDEDLKTAGIYQEDKPISVFNLKSQKDVDDAMRKVLSFKKKQPYEIDAYIDVRKLNTPFIYEEYDDGDDFVSTVFSDEQLNALNINKKDFNGFLRERGYKSDIQKFKSLGLDSSSFGTGYDAQLNYERKKVQYLNMYINDQLQRDVRRQKLDYEKNNGVNPDLVGVKFKPGFFSSYMNLDSYQDFLKKEAPMLVAKMEEVDLKNQQKYEQLVKSKGNASVGKFIGELASNGWNGVSRAVNTMSSSIYGLMPGDFFEGVAESIREQQSTDEMLKGSNFRYVSANGYRTEFNGVSYIVGGDNQIYDVTNKLNVTNILTNEQTSKIKDKARVEGNRDTSFSLTGTSYQAADVIGDMVFQLALTRGAGNGMKAVGGLADGLGVLGKTKDFLRSVPLKRSLAEATLAQSAIGFSNGYQETLKAAREAGINDTKAKELAALASIETGAWYAMTAWINPQSKTTDMLFGKPKAEILEAAINAYRSGGKKAFVNSIKQAGKGFVNITGEGFAELIQENIQQAGETFVVNRDVNEEAGMSLLKDTMSLQDFIDTSILSFVAGSAMPGAGTVLNSSNKTIRQMLGMDAVDRFNALNTLASNQEKVENLLASQVAQGVYTQQQADDLINEIEAYSSSINKMPQDISADAAEKILADVVELSKLEQQRREIDKSFYAVIDERIDEVRSRIERVYYDDVTSKRTSTIKKAIQEGKAGNLEYREFDSFEDMKETLMSEFNFSESSAESTASNPGFILTDDNLKTLLPSDKYVPGKKIIFINNSMAAEMSQFSVGKHEFLHGLIYETIKGDKEAQILLGKSLANEILSINQQIEEGLRKGVSAPKGFMRRFKQYVDKYSRLIEGKKILLKEGRITQTEYDNIVDTYLGNQWEEVLTLYSDAIDNGSVVFDEDIFTKIGDMIRRVLQRLGIKDIKFSSGKDVYNFVKDYNRSIEKGDFGGSLAKIATKKAVIDKESLRKQVGEKPKQTKQEEKKEENKFTTDAKFSLKSDRIDPEKFKREINSFYDKDKWSDQNYLDSVLYDILDKYAVTIKQKAKGYGYSYLPDYSEEDMVAETQIGLINVIRNFNKEFLELRNEYKNKLKARGLKETSAEFKEEINKQDEKGYDGKKGKVKENTDLNAYVNSLLKFKMMDALKTGSVTSKQYDEDIDSETFRESRIESFESQEEDMLDDVETLLEQQNEFEREQGRLAVLLRDPIFGFTDENGKPVEIETIPFGANFVQDADDPIVPANKKLKNETDPELIKILKKQVEDLRRGLELESKESLTQSEKDELKALKSFKSYDLSSGGMVNTYQALSQLDKPAVIMSNEIAREILRAPNIETLEYRNFKDKLGVTSQTFARRMTFKNSETLNRFMYDNWKLIYDVINNPVDPITGESTYASKKLPPRLRQLDEEGNFIKRKDIDRTKFLQSYFGDEDTKKIIMSYSTDPEAEISLLEDTEVNDKTGSRLWSTAYFDRRTALMELFGDVLVLQEARRLLREDYFLESIKERNVNLYNDLKDDTKRTAVLNNMAKGKSDIVKFSLAEKQNNKNSDYMSDASGIEEQLFIAKILDKAIQNAKSITKSKVTFKVPNLKEMSDKAKSFFIIDKVSQGYNNFEFLSKDDTKGLLTKSVLENADIKFTLAEERAEYNDNLEIAMNEIIEENKGVDVFKKFSPETAKNLGKNIGKSDLFLPPADEDFLGLVYRLATAKGEKGKQQLQFFEDNLIKPYSDAMLNVMHARRVTYADWKALTNVKYKGIIKKLKKDSGYGNYTIDQAVRVYLWDKAGYEIPGLDARDLFELKNVVRRDKELRDFATDVSYISKQPNGYIEPDHNWGYGSLVGDINNVISKANRKKYLVKWQENVDKIFSKDNLSKIEALYGREYTSALKNSLDRMKLGTNRLDNSSDSFVNWLNGATGVTMFFNMRSAVLQTISATNFINTGDNNVVKAGMAMMNQNQFWKDFIELWGSDYLKDRRSGLMNDVAESELAQAMNDSRNKNILDRFKAVNYLILKYGFGPTRVADSFAIAFGGAAFYRNRIKTYIKQGDSEADAKSKAMRDFYETAETSQQSADTSKISKNQSTIKGRLIFAFQNTPLQYGRIMKRAVIDIAKGRGSLPNNIAKLVYYGALQNIFFNVMQNALFTMLFDDDEDESEYDKKMVRSANGVMDTILRGSGVKGAVISTVKNIIIKWMDVHGDPKAGGEVVVEALNLSPQVGIKARKLLKTYKTLEYNADEIKYKGFSVDNTYAIEAVTTVTSAALNTPVDRLYQKTLNIADAFDAEYNAWQKAALLMGFNKWNLGKGNKSNPNINSKGQMDGFEMEDIEMGEDEFEWED